MEEALSARLNVRYDKASNTGRQIHRLMATTTKSKIGNIGQPVQRACDLRCVHKTLKRGEEHRFRGESAITSIREKRERKKERQEGVHQTHSSLIYVIGLHTASVRRLDTTPMLHVSKELA